MSQLKAGDLAAARRTFERLADQAPDVAGLWIALGRVHYQEKDYRAALRMFQRALRIEPESAAAVALSARAREQLGDTGKALLEYEEASELDPSLGFPQMRLSRLFAEEKDYDEAIRRLREALEHNPQQVRVRMMLADIIEKSGDAAAAKAELERAVEIEPDNVTALNKLAQRELKGQNFAAARSYFERAMQLSPDKAGPQLGYGIACASLGDHQAAVTAFAELQKQQPNLGSVTFRLVDSHVALKQPEEALRVLHQAIKRSRNSAPIHKRIGDLYVSMGRFTQALEEYRAAVLNKPELAENDAELSSLLDAGGDPEFAATEVQKKLAVLADDADSGLAEAGSGRQRRFDRLRNRLRQTG